MTEETRILLAEGEALRRETEEVIAGIDAYLEAMDRLEEAELALEREMRNAAAILEEWFL
jgi:hypothetical protein